jgi:hypothetical protein
MLPVINVFSLHQGLKTTGRRNINFDIPKKKTLSVNQVKDFPKEIDEQVSGSGVFHDDGFLRIFFYLFHVRDETHESQRGAAEKIGLGHAIDVDSQVSGVINVRNERIHGIDLPEKEITLSYTNARFYQGLLWSWLISPSGMVFRYHGIFTSAGNAALRLSVSFHTGNA